MDPTSLASLFSPLNIQNDLTSTGSLLDSSNSGVQPNYSSMSAAPVSDSVANPLPTSTSGFSSVLSGLTSLFDSGVAVYNDVAAKTGLPTANGTPTVVTVPAAASPVMFGLTQTQLWMISGGIVLIAVLLILKRR